MFLKRFLTALMITGMSGIPVTAFAAPLPLTNLKAPAHKASGQGTVTTTGTIPSEPDASPDEPSDVLKVASLNTWKVGHGIRVTRAGSSAPVNGAEVEDAHWEKVHPEATVVEDINDETGEDDVRDGLRSVQCGLPSAVIVVPVDICGVSLGSAVSFFKDELLLWVKPSKALARGQLQIMLFTASGRVEFGALELPAVPPNTWTRAGVRIEGEGGLQITRLELRCNRNCGGLSVHLDGLRVVEDLFAFVGQIMSENRIRLVDRNGAAVHAASSVANERVFHDDTLAVQRWLAVGDANPGELYAPVGTYYINAPQIVRDPGYPAHVKTDSLIIGDGVTLRCQSTKSVFKSSGGAHTGISRMFRTRAASPSNITVQSCAFDANGWNREDFLTLLDLGADPGAPGGPHRATNIRILNNRFFDSNPPGRNPCLGDKPCVVPIGQHGCDIDQDDCDTRQRQHILVRGAVGIESAPGVMNVPGAIIEGNSLSNGGRIKAGGLSRAAWIFIRNNAVNFINDNGITVAQSGGVTERVQITNNSVKNAVGVGVFFGADGEELGGFPGTTTRDVLIADNSVSGYFHAGIKGILGEVAERIDVFSNVVEAIRTRQLSPMPSVGIMLKRGKPACSDDADNDADKKKDFPADLECAGLADNSEGPDTTSLNLADTADIYVTDNQVMSSGTFGFFGLAAVLFEGPLKAITMKDNLISCRERFPIASTTPEKPCLARAADRGVLLRTGPIENVEIVGNVLADAGLGLVISNLAAQPAQGLSIHDNHFLRATSTVSDDAQLKLHSSPGSEIAGFISSNLFEAGGSWGIYCVTNTAGAYTLTFDPPNTFVGHTDKEISSPCKT